MESPKIKVYIVDIEENTISRLEELFYKNPHLGVKIIGYSYNYNGCINDFSRAKEAEVFLISAYLPDTMGTELIGQVKKINPNAKIIVTLSKNTRNLAEVSKEKGADDFIQKPFKAKQLLEKFYEITNKTNPTEDESYAPSDETNDQEENSYETEENYPPYQENPEEYDTTSQSNTERNSYDLINQYPLSLEEENDNIYQPENYETTETNIFSPIEENFDQEDTIKNRTLFDGFNEENQPSSIYKDPDEFDGEKPNIICVFSSAGSNGKTTMLVNAAVTIQKYSIYKPKICIVDFNLLFPSVLYKFHQDDLLLCKKNIFDLFDDINSLTPEIINSALVTHEPTGIKILETPSEVVRDITRVNPENIQQLLTHLREMFDLILIDTSSNIREDSTSFPLTIADKGIILLEPDLSNLLHTRKLISLLKMFEANLSEKIIPKLNFILNKENPKAIVHVDTIKKTLHNIDIRLTIPEDNIITHYSNSGEFLINKNSVASKSVKELSRLIYPFNEEFMSINQKNKTKGFLNSLFKKK